MSHPLNPFIKKSHSASVSNSLSRRRFLKTTTGATIGVMMAMQINSVARANLITVPAPSDPNNTNPNNWCIGLIGANTTPDEPIETSTFSVNANLSSLSGGAIVEGAQAIIRRHVKTTLLTQVPSSVIYDLTAYGDIKVEITHEICVFENGVFKPVATIPNGQVTNIFRSIVTIDPNTGEVTEQIHSLNADGSTKEEDNDFQEHGITVTYSYADGLTDRSNILVSGIPAPLNNQTFYGLPNLPNTSAKGAPDFQKENVR